MKDWPLNALRAFSVVHASGGIRAASRELGVAHSSVSRHLRELEAWLGVPLARSEGGRSGLIFTPQGELLAKATENGFHAIAQALDVLREARSEHSVIITTTPSLASRWLLGRLPVLHAAHRRLEVSVVVERALDDLDNGGVDFGLRMGRGPWPGLRCEPLMDDMLYPVMSPACWQASGRPQKPSALRRLRLLHDRDPQASWARWKQAHGPASLDARKGPRFASSDLVLRAAAQGQGVALARHQLAREDVDAGVLIRPFPELCVPIGTAYWLVMSARATPSPAAGTVMDWLRETAATG